MECASKARQVLPASLLAAASAAGMAAVPSTPLQSPVKVSHLGCGLWNISQDHGQQGSLLNFIGDH
eukprot:scaffold80194_cov20-Tisochrysis_lutea.AAC.1